uniref:Uncharacterized protein n=1 Tax=Anguilla anguilla TaxID=7936 RepID=A0A0E9VVE6_ANGAN
MTTSPSVLTVKSWELRLSSASSRSSKTQT